jgi:hypothetical protein
MRTDIPRFVGLIVKSSFVRDILLSDDCSMYLPDEAAGAKRVPICIVWKKWGSYLDYSRVPHQYPASPFDSPAA